MDKREQYEMTRMAQILKNFEWAEEITTIQFGERNIQRYSQFYDQYLIEVVHMLMKYDEIHAGKDPR